MYGEYGDRVGFLFVYIREAHPSDEWQVESNTEDEVVLAQPSTLGERQSVARTCSLELSLTMPGVVDDMENTVDEAYAAWPERLFIVDADGIIAYAGKQGPFGFEPGEVDDWLRRHVGPPK